MIDAKFYRNKETGAVVYGVVGSAEAADFELLQAGVTDGATPLPFVLARLLTQCSKSTTLSSSLLLLRTALSLHNLSLVRSQLLPSLLRKALRLRLMSTAIFMVFGRLPSKSTCPAISNSLLVSNGAAICSSIFITTPIYFWVKTN